MFAAVGVREGSSVCALVNEGGVFVAAAVAEDHSSRETYSGATKTMAYISAALYSLLCLCAFFQIYHIVRVHFIEKANAHDSGIAPARLFMACITVLYALARAIYFSLPPLKEPVASMVLFELPTVLFYVMYTSVFYLWSEMIYRVKNLLIGTRRTVVFYIYICLNVILGVIFVVFILVFFFTEGESARLPCQAFQLRPNASSRHMINVAYLVFIAILSVLFALAYLAIGSYLMRSPLVRSSKFRKRLFRMTALITATFASMSIARSLLMLLSALIDIPVPIIVFSLLEVIPAFGSSSSHLPTLIGMIFYPSHYSSAHVVHSADSREGRTSFLDLEILNESPQSE